ncbi:MAG: hypothetical protein MK102_17755 [Fuerstiella sp.]|nr:hypothetical protein [Fuerstiella sp.]
MSRRKRRNHSRFTLFAFQDIITCVMGIMLLLTLMMCLQITSSVASARVSSVEQTLDEMKQQAVALAGEIEQLQQTASDQTVLLNSGAIDDPELLRDHSLKMTNEIQLATADVRELQQQQDDSQTSLESTKNTVKARRTQAAQTEALRAENRNLNRRLDDLRQGNRIIYNAHDSSSATCWLVELTNPGTIQAAEMGMSRKPLTFASRSDLQSWMTQHHRSGAAFLILVKPDAAEILEPLTAALRARKVTYGFDLLPQDKAAIDPVSGAAVQ